MTIASIIVPAYNAASYVRRAIASAAAQTERRIAAFVDAGLDDYRIRAWTVIRGSYLQPEHADRLSALLD